MSLDRQIVSIDFSHANNVTNFECAFCVRNNVKNLGAHASMRVNCCFPNTRQDRIVSKSAYVVIYTCDDDMNACMHAHVHVMMNMRNQI